MNFYEWANRWGVSVAAVEELKESLGYNGASDSGDLVSETGVQKTEQLRAAREGTKLFRNNVGACVDERGNHIRYGLANISKEMNKKFKSSDLIGIKPVTITPDMVGQVIGQFVARECKEPGWHYTGTDREEAQGRFIVLIQTHGGDAKFISG